jgi:hypothetical protein
VVWECFLNEPYRTSEDPADDPAHVALWTGFEQQLLSRLPPFERIITTWEDMYDRPAWQAFLVRQGYRPYGPAAPAAFVKDVARG